MGAKKKVLENSFLYTFSSILVKATGFLLLPFYTFFLTPEDYGITNLINSFLQVTIYVVTFSLNAGIVRFYVDFKHEEEKLKEFISTIVIFIIFTTNMFIFLSLIFNGFVTDLLFENLSFYPIVLIALISVFFIVMHSVHQHILQAMQIGRRLTKINLIVFFIQVSLNIILISVFKLGAVGMLLAQLFVYFGYIFFMLFDLRKNHLLALRFNFKLLFEALKYSIPLIPHNLSTRIASFFSRVVMNSGGTIALVGLYSVAFQFGTVIDTVQSSVNKAFRPWFFEMMKKGDQDNKREVIQISTILLTLYSLVYMIIGLFSQEAILLMTTEKYVLSWTVIPILTVAFSAKSIYYFYVNILFYYKTIANRIFIATLTGSFADIIFALILIPKYGMYGAALAFLTAKIIVSFIVYIMSRKYNQVGFKLVSMIKIIIPSLVFMGIGLYFSYTKYITQFNLFNFTYKLFVLALYILYIFLMNKKYIMSTLPIIKSKFLSRN